MALTFPLGTGDFIVPLKTQSITFELPDAVEQKTTGGGEVITSQHGVRLWRGSVTIAIQTWAEHEAAMALIRALGRPATTFNVTPLHMRRTTAPSGQLYSVDNGVDVRLSALPVGTVIPAGAFFHFSYSGRRAFHQVVQGATANGSGIAGPVEVVPPIRSGFTLNTAVDFANPSCRAVLVPGSVQSGRIRSVLADGVSFDWRQTLK